MPDYIVLDISYISREFLLKLPFLEFKELVSMTTGEAGHKKVAIYCGLRIILYRTRAFIKGSIHKAFNLISKGGRAHNCNDFTYSNFQAVVSFLREKISLDPSKTLLVTLEFGVNINVHLSATKIVEKHFFSYKFLSGPEEDKNFARKGKYKKFATTQYQIKAYDKSRQCHLNSFVLRIELRTLKAQYTQRLKIFTLLDLLKRDALHQLGIELLKRINEILILDEYNPMATPEYWISLKAKTEPRTFLRRRKDYIGEMEAKQQFQLKKDILNKVGSKLSELID